MTVETRVRRPRLGSVVNKGFDAEGYERREQLVAIGECDHCGKRIELWQSTVEWVQGRDGRWKHNAYDGLGIGWCCGSMYADDWDGCRRFDPETPNCGLSRRTTQLRSSYDPRMPQVPSADYDIRKGVRLWKAAASSSVGFCFASSWTDQTRRLIGKSQSLVLSQADLPQVPLAHQQERGEADGQLHQMWNCDASRAIPIALRCVVDL